MNCDEAEELLAAYALDALPPDDAERMRHHLATCGQHARALAELRKTAASLAFASTPSEAPAALRARIVSAAAASPQHAPAGPGAEGAHAAAASRPQQGTARDVRRWPRARLSWAPLAAAAAVIIALAVWNVSLMRSGDDGELAVHGPVRLAQVEGDGVRAGFVAYFPETGQALFVADGLPPLDPRESTYQLWAIVDGEAESLGLLGAPDSGGVATTVKLDDPDGLVLAVTVEPAGGSQQPTSDPVVRARL